jgi:hypothetical protein
LFKNDGVLLSKERLNPSEVPCLQKFFHQRKFTAEDEGESKWQEEEEPKDLILFEVPRIDNGDNNRTHMAFGVWIARRKSTLSS